MSDAPPMILSRGRVEARIRVAEGGVVDELRIDGRSVLARTPWTDEVVRAAEPAMSEADWVARWRGGWQLCFPSTGEADEGASTPQGFHGVASQAPWTPVEVADDHLTLRWQDVASLRAERTLRLTDDGIEASTSAVNGGADARRIAVAEHCILGGEVLTPLSAGATLALEVPTGSVLAPLDLAGCPAGPPTRWPGDPAAHWETVERTTPARLAALVGRDEDAVGPRRVAVHGPHVRAVVTWSGLPHLLVWEELAASPEPPWGGAIMALGIEPTSTPHGIGTASREGIVTLRPGGRMDWRTELAIHWTGS